MADMFLSMNASITAFQIKTKDYASLNTESYSVGNICWDGDIEYYYASGHVMRAHRSDVIDVTTGNRQGRSVTTTKAVAQYGDRVYAYLGRAFIDMCEWGTVDGLGD